MTSHRDPSVYLDPAEPRCEPAALPQCGRFTCGRYKATVPKMGRVEDFNRDRAHFSVRCEKYISSELKPPAQSASRPTFKSLGG